VRTYIDHFSRVAEKAPAVPKGSLRVPTQRASNPLAIRVDTFALPD